MLFAAISFTLFEDFFLWNRSLDLRLMKLSVVHNPWRFGFAIEVSGFVTASIGWFQTESLIYFRKCLASSHGFELRWDLIRLGFLDLLPFSTFNHCHQVLLGFFLLFLSCRDLFVASIPELSLLLLLSSCDCRISCILFLRAKWSLFKKYIFDILISLAWPPIHFRIQVLLLSYVLSNCSNPMTLRKCTFSIFRCWIWLNFILHVHVRIFLLFLLVSFFVDDLL